MDSGKRARIIGSIIFAVLGLGCFVYIILNSKDAGWIVSGSDIAYMYFFYFGFLLFVDSCLITAAYSLYFQKSFIKTALIVFILITAALYLSAAIQGNKQKQKTAEINKQDTAALNSQIELWLTRSQFNKAKVEKLTAQYDIKDQSRFFSAGKDAFYILNQDGSPQKIESSGNLNILPSKKNIFSLSGEDKVEIADPANSRKISMTIGATNSNNGFSGIELIDYSSDYKYLISSLWFNKDTASEHVFIIINISDGSVQYVREKNWPSFCKANLPASSCSGSKAYSLDEKPYSDTSGCESTIYKQSSSNYEKYNKLLDGYELSRIVYPICMTEGNYYLAAMSKSEPSDGRLIELRTATANNTQERQGTDSAYPQEDYSIIKIDNKFTTAQKIIEIPNKSYPNTEPETWFLQSPSNENIFFEVVNHSSNVASVVYFDRKSGGYKTVDQPTDKDNHRLMEISRE